MIQSDLIFNPTEILDERQKEWEASNPEMAARDPEKQVYMKPEYYEEEMQKRHEEFLRDMDVPEEGRLAGLLVGCDFLCARPSRVGPRLLFLCSRA